MTGSNQCAFVHKVMQVKEPNANSPTSMLTYTADPSEHSQSTTMAHPECLVGRLPECTSTHHTAVTFVNVRSARGMPAWSCALSWLERRIFLLQRWTPDSHKSTPLKWRNELLLPTIYMLYWSKGAFWQDRLFQITAFLYQKPNESCCSKIKATAGISVSILTSKRSNLSERCTLGGKSSLRSAPGTS